MPAFDMGEVTEIFAPDGIWHTVMGAPTATTNPVFTSGTGQPITTPETWISFQDSADMKVYAFPVSDTILVRYTP